MTDFTYTQKVDAPLADIQNTALGTGGADIYGTVDIGKPLKVSSSGTMAICADGDEIEGFLSSVEVHTVNEGYSFGAAKRDQRVEALVGPSQVGNIAQTALVVADIQIAIGTESLAKVKTGTPATFKWRVLEILSGTGASGDKVLLERV